MVTPIYWKIGGLHKSVFCQLLLYGLGAPIISAFASGFDRWFSQIPGFVIRKALAGDGWLFCHVLNFGHTIEDGRKAHFWCFCLGKFSIIQK